MLPPTTRSQMDQWVDGWITHDTVALTLGFLQKNDLRVGAEVLPGQDHLLAAQNGAAVHVLLLHHGKLMCRALGCGDNKDLDCLSTNVAFSRVTLNKAKLLETHKKTLVDKMTKYQTMLLFKYLIKFYNYLKHITSLC